MANTSDELCLDAKAEDEDTSRNSITGDAPEFEAAGMSYNDLVVVV